MSEHAEKALALVLAYRKAASAAREPVEPCEHVSQRGEGVLGCYLIWKDGMLAHQWHADEWGPAPEWVVTDEDLADWCEPCQRGHEVWQRRKAARQERGKVLRRMHALARRVNDES